MFFCLQSLMGVVAITQILAIVTNPKWAKLMIEGNPKVSSKREKIAVVNAKKSKVELLI